MSSIRHRLGRHNSRRSPEQHQGLLESQHRHRFQQRRQNGRSPLPEFGATLFYLPSVMDDLSVDLGHTAGHFESVKSCMRQVYHLLIGALGRHDPLPWMVRDAIESVALAPPPLTLGLVQGARPQQQQLLTRHPVTDQQVLLHKSDIETITAMDIPYALRHFDFDLSAAVNISEGSRGGGRGGGGSGGTVCFSLSDTRTEIRSSFENSRRACRAVADLLVAGRLASTVRQAAIVASGGVVGGVGGSCSGFETSGTPAGTYAPHNSVASSSAKGVVTSSSSSASSPSAFLPTTSDIGGGGGGRRGDSKGLAGLTLTMIGAMDGSNSNRATNTLMSNSGLPAASTVAPSELGASASVVGYGGGGGIGRLCPMHMDRSGGPVSESSCAVCASQHFIHRHLQRLAQEAGGAGLARLEVALCDSLQLQEQWRRSVRWVAANVKDKRLPESIRPLVRCICAADAASCCGAGGADAEYALGRGVTVNPQIIISTDGHCSALKCAASSAGLSGGGGGGGGGGGASSCCWDAPPSVSRDAF